MPENTIPVRQLRAVIGSRWRRTGLFSAAGEQPIFHLVRQDRPDDLTAQLGGHLGGGVPHVLLSADQALPDNELHRSVLMREQLLDKVALGLGRHDSRRWQGRIRFRRYALASYLLQHNEEPPEPDEVPNRQARELLGTYVRGRLFGLKSRRAETEGAGAGARVDATVHRVEPLGLPWYLLLPAMLLSWALPPAIQRGVVLRRPARWFLRQHYLSPRESADFASFAQRLLSRPSVHENANQVRKFLVHALLEDLADAYARRVGRWRWMRRDNYPVLLLQGVTPGTTGELLIRLINDVRNETGARDPLLVVASGPEELPHGTAPADPMTVEGWQKQLLEARRKRSPTAWYLPLRVENPPTDVEPLPAFPRGQAPIRTKRARVLRVMPALLAVIVVAGAGGWYVKEWAQHCGQLRPWAGGDLIWADPDGFGDNNGECVGVSDGYVFSQPDGEGDETREALAQAQTRIHELNEKADELHRNQKDLPYVTIIYFSVLTTTNSDSTALTAALEELRGVADAQEESRMARLPLRVLIANGGEGMRHAPDVAERINSIAREADSTNAAARGDARQSGAPREATSPVVGVVGMGGSREITKEAIADLGDGGLPTIGITTSADSMWRSSKLYFQVAPPNKDQAAVVGRYVQDHLDVPIRKVTIYKEDDDAYSENLADDVRRELIGRGIAEINVTDDNASVARSCGRDTVLFFAGRSERLNEFLSNQTCDPGERPQLIAGDDITKFVLDDQMPDHTDLRLDYVSFNKLQHSGSTSQGRSALARDAMKLLGQAVDQFKYNGLPLNGLTVWNELSHTKSMLTGSTGAIVYDRSDQDLMNDQVPVHKAITIERIEGGAQESRTLLVCGDHQANKDQRPEGCTWLGG
ncbi:hypothetical protein OOZ19_05535 [Saccharopolyspora sp. NFXS83]|uniref:ABC transporter substrate-binding protein n=1 Tax=Saccharopolyspora sp. NFXS83 TaxID=2993560 RepID=UPI00224AB16A|nr:hypothetical protein [Saccharopolyspora sp. NFXS83]MCX2729691.1 hypothetical protein [Saccharopolyspora sp. NFXS83]